MSVGAANPSHNVRSGVPRTQGETSKQAKILKYVNNRNEDGSYTYGFQVSYSTNGMRNKLLLFFKSSDGTYKTETRTITGEVGGQFGYVDPDGKLRESSYGNLDILKLGQQMNKNQKARTKAASKQSSRKDQIQIHESFSKEWREFHTAFKPVKSLLKSSEDTIKRQKKLVIFPLQKMISIEEKLA